MNHQYVIVRPIEKQIPTTTIWYSAVRVVCAICGDARNVWEDGIIEVYKEGDFKLHDTK